MSKGLKTLMKNAIISEVKPNSIAWEFELKAGDKIIQVNDKELTDLIDFNFETATNEYTLTVEKKETGEIEVLEIEKDDDEELEDDLDYMVNELWRDICWKYGDDYDESDLLETLKEAIENLG